MNLNLVVYYVAFVIALPAVIITTIFEVGACVSLATLIRKSGQAGTGAAPSALPATPAATTATQPATANKA